MSERKWTIGHAATADADPEPATEEAAANWFEGADRLYRMMLDWAMADDRRHAPGQSSDTYRAALRAWSAAPPAYETDAAYEIPRQRGGLRRFYLAGERS